MKTKCPECGTGKARRLCARKNGVEICSACCASIRSAECGDCVHYGDARRYESMRHRSTGHRPEHFIAEFNPKLNDAINDAIQVALKGEAETAMTCLTALLREHPNNHDLCYGIGTIHALQENQEEAIRWLDKAIDIFPYAIEAHYNKAVAYQNISDLTNAARAFQKVVEYGDPEDPEVAKAKSYLDHMEAIILKTEDVKLEPYLQSSEKFDQAIKLMEIGDWQGALDGFEKSAAINPRNAPSHGNMGLCHARLGRKARALAELDRAIELNPKYEPAITNRISVQEMEEGKALKGGETNFINFGAESAKSARS